MIFDATPAMADVVSGAAPKPRARKKRENWFQWLAQTPAWKRVIDHFDLDSQWPGVEHRPDLRPPLKLELEAFPNIYTLAWNKPPTAHAILLCVNSDGTRCAILGAWAEIARLWESARRPTAGRPRTDTDNPKSLYQREYRERKK